MTTMTVDANNPLLKKKWERVFTTFFDMNKSKTIDWNDFEMLFEKIKQLRGDTSTEYKIASDAMLAVWKGLLQTTKGIDMTEEAPADVHISLAEWNSIWAEYNPRHMPIWQWEYLKYMFFLLDSSGDKVIDLEEYQSVMKMYGLDTKDSKKAFDQLSMIDTKAKSGKIDYGIFVKLWNEYFTSTDPKSPGNHLFGPN